ncbi:MAG: hypothetical protein ACNS60_15270 [Candidatus Cyclobacteriaceae bacterium M2_1C_046]
MYSSEHPSLPNVPKRAKNDVGIYIDNPKSMSKTSYRQVLLIFGVLVAIIVILLLNFELFPAQQSELDSANKIKELAHYSIPNIIFYLY